MNKADDKIKLARHSYFRGINKLTTADYVFMLILFLLAISVIFPFLNVIAISLSSDAAFLKNPAMLFPRDIHFNAYRALLSGPGIWRSLGFTLFYIVSFVFLRIITSLFAGFSISRRGLPGKRFMITFLLIPTLFSGGMVPTYLIISSLGFVDNILVFIIPGCVSCFHILLMKTFIQGLPDSVEEAAKVDGANLMQLLFRIIIPMCIPIILTIGMLTAISKWNDWWIGFMYTTSDKLYLLPIQNVIRKLTLEPSTDMRSLGISMANIGESFKMASIMVVTLPIMLIYPFIQKYFEQGLNVGSVKD